MQYLFKGKRVDNGEWEKGSLLIDEQGNHYISGVANKAEHYVMYGRGGIKTGARFEGIGLVQVIPETTGQFIGITDVKGVEIFSGDIVDVTYKSGYVGVSDTYFGKGVVEYHGTYYGGAAYHINIIGEPGSRVFSAGIDGGVTVIGNIHDNPEMLKGGVEA